MNTQVKKSSYLNPLESDLLELIIESRGIATGVIKLRRPQWKEASLRSMLRSLKSRDLIYLGDGYSYHVTGAGERALAAKHAKESNIIHVQFRTNLQEAA